MLPPPSHAGVHDDHCPAGNGCVPVLATKGQARLLEGQSHGCPEETVWRMGGGHSDKTTKDSSSSTQTKLKQKL